MPGSLHVGDTHKSEIPYRVTERVYDANRQAGGAIFATTVTARAFISGRLADSYAAPFADNFEDF